MIFMPILVPATVSAVACGLVAIALTSNRTARLRATRGRLEPVLLQTGALPLGQAAVYATPLRIRYRDLDGGISESVVVPKNIVGRKAARGVRPDVVNVFCQGRQAMRSLRFEGILWAEDVHSGDLIEDLHSYFGGAQPGGAPAPLYPAPPTSPSPDPRSRH